MLAEVQNLAYKLAWDASAQYRLPFDECLGEAYWQFMRAWNYYDPKRRVKFSSFYTQIFKWQFKSRITEKVKRQQRLPQIEFKDNLRGVLKLTAPATRSPCLEIWEDLSEDAREIVELLVEETPKKWRSILSPELLLTRVKRSLMCRGYTHDRFEAAQEEIRRRFQGVWKHKHSPEYALNPVEFRSLLARGIIGFSYCDEQEAG